MPCPETATQFNAINQGIGRGQSRIRAVDFFEFAQSTPTNAC